MDIPVITDRGTCLAEITSDRFDPEMPTATVLSGLLAVADRVLGLAADLLPAGIRTTDEVSTDAIEPVRTGLYRDRDGDIWQKTDQGWRLCLQHGVAVDVRSTWDWERGHVRDYGPFVPLAMN